MNRLDIPGTPQGKFIPPAEINPEQPGLESGMAFQPLVSIVRKEVAAKTNFKKREFEPEQEKYMQRIKSELEGILLELETKYETRHARLKERLVCYTKRKDREGVRYFEIQLRELDQEVGSAAKELVKHLVRMQDFDEAQERVATMEAGEGKISCQEVLVSGLARAGYLATAKKLANEIENPNRQNRARVTAGLVANTPLTYDIKKRSEAAREKS